VRDNWAYRTSPFSNYLIHNNNYAPRSYVPQYYAPQLYDPQYAPRLFEPQYAPRTPRTVPLDPQYAPRTPRTVPLDPQYAPRTPRTVPLDPQHAPHYDNNNCSTFNYHRLNGINDAVSHVTNFVSTVNSSKAMPSHNSRDPRMFASYSKAVTAAPHVNSLEPPHVNSYEPPPVNLEQEFTLAAIQMNRRNGNLSKSDSIIVENSSVH